MTLKELLLLGFGAYQMKKLRAAPGFVAFEHFIGLESGLRATCRLQKLSETDQAEVMVLVLKAPCDMPGARDVACEEAKAFFFDRVFTEVPGYVDEGDWHLRSFFTANIPTQKEIADFVKARSRPDSLTTAKPIGERTQTYVQGDHSGHKHKK